jgi:hypothetical protein
MVDSGSLLQCLIQPAIPNSNPAVRAVVVAFKSAQQIQCTFDIVEKGIYYLNLKTNGVQEVLITSQPISVYAGI